MQIRQIYANFLIVITIYTIYFIVYIVYLTILFTIIFTIVYTIFFTILSINNTTVAIIKIVVYIVSTINSEKGWENENNRCINRKRWKW